MKKNDVKTGKFYTAKVSNRMATIRIDAESPHGGWEATNITTGKKVRIKSAQRLRRETRGPGERAKTKAKTGEELKAVHKADQENARLADERAASGDGQTASERAMAESAGDAAKVKKAKAAGKKTSGLDAAAQVLAEAGEPLNTKTMVERMLAQGLWQTNGKTPSATIYAAITREIATKGGDARFRKVGRGQFELAKGA